MDIRAFFRKCPRTSRGGAAAKNGFEYERLVYAQFKRLKWNGEPVNVLEPAGANKTAHDITLLNKEGLTLEAKTKGAFEGGAKTMKYRNGAFQLPEDVLLSSMIVSGITLPLWNGFIPSCMKGDKTDATWLAEKHLVSEIRKSVPSSVVADYYRAKGTAYLQIEDSGIYHTGDDVMKWNVPKFEPECSIRIRMKQHGGGHVPSDCQASFNYKHRSLPPSPYDFMNPSRLPPGFTMEEE